MLFLRKCVYNIKNINMPHKTYTYKNQNLWLEVICQYYVRNKKKIFILSWSVNTALFSCPIFDEIDTYNFIAYIHILFSNKYIH